jgi:hypothetical protein
MLVTFWSGIKTINALITTNKIASKIQR